MELTTKRVQEFEWGQLQWISEPDSDHAANKLLIGDQTISIKSKLAKWLIVQLLATA